MAVYIFNSPVLTSFGEFRFTGPIDASLASSRITPGFVSAIGHEASALFLSRLLCTDIQMNRISVAMQPGDEALVLRIKTRLPEGEVLSEEAFQSIPYELGWLVRTA